ncbi:MAG TPA: dTDP-4-dehydrorhamnose reductase [Patescibacteria group bacterium]|nr:dTDP-4-dehydrorhamnose reductase [Patescibacteria group bacterium]
MKVLVTGGKGQLGRAFAQIGAEYRHQWEYYDIEEMDITRAKDVFAAVEQLKPDAVIHGAAYTQVDKAETDIDGAYRVNVIGTQNIAAACLKFNVKMVYVSTDYVFDGMKQQPYTEFDPVNPLSVYGKTKLEGERLAARICPRLFIARTAWLYGEGNNFVKTMLRLAGEREYLTVVSDQTGTPTYAVDLARGILSILETEAYGTYHMTNQGQSTWYDFAREIFRQTGISKEVRPLRTEEYPVPAKRPQHSILRNYMLELTVGDSFRPWEEALSEYIRTLD